MLSCIDKINVVMRNSYISMFEARLNLYCHNIVSSVTPPNTMFPIQDSRINLSHLTQCGGSESGIEPPDLSLAHGLIRRDGCRGEEREDTGNGKGKAPAGRGEGRLDVKYRKQAFIVFRPSYFLPDTTW